MEKVNKKQPKRFKDVLKKLKENLRKNNPTGGRLVHTAWVHNLMEQLEESATDEYIRGVGDGLNLAKTIMNNQLDSFIDTYRKRKAAHIVAAC